MNVSAVAYRPRPIPAGEPPQAPPPADNPPQQPPPELGDKFVDNLLASPEFTKQLTSKMGGGGNTVVVTVEGKEILKIESSGPTFMEKTIRGGQLLISAAAEEASKVVQADPAFAFKESALGVKTQVYNGLPKEIQGVADAAFLPMLRVVALLLDAKKLTEVLHNKDAPVLDKVVDSVHVATDVVGLVGALGEKFIPALTPFSSTMTAIGLAGDIAAYSYHVLAYLKERGQVNVVPPTQQQAA